MSREEKDSHKGMGVPARFFMESALRIQQRVAFEEELRQFPGLRNLNRYPGFVVPAGFFVEQERQLERGIYPGLPLNRNTGYEVPEGYFENNTARLLQRLGATRGHGFRVKEDYFDQNKTKLREALLKDEPKILSIKIKQFWHYAAAAMLLVTVSIFTYRLYLNDPRDAECGTMACIEREALIRSAEMNVLNDEELYDLADPELLERNLNLDKQPAGGSGDSVTEEADDLYYDI